MKSIFRDLGKSWLAFVVTAAFLFSQSVISQNIIVVEPAVNEALVLRLGEYKGTLQWQASPDGGRWSDVPNATADTLAVSASNSLYYRGSLTVPGCPEYYTDTVQIHASLSPPRIASRFPIFDWDDHPKQFADVGKPVNYVIQIANDEKFTSMIDHDTIGLSRYVHAHPFEPGIYYWRTRAITFDGGITWGEINSFEVKAPDRIVTVDVPAGTEDATSFVKSAVSQAQTLAASGHSVQLVFPAGNYYFGNDLSGALINFNNVKNIDVEGTGATLHFSRRNQGLMSAGNCENISISGFKTTYAANIFRVQGYVQAVNQNTRAVVVALDVGSPDFSKSGSMGDIFILLDPVIDGRMKMQTSNHYRMNDYVANGDGTYTISISEGSISNWEVGDRFVYHFRAGSASFLFFPDCKNITAYNLTTDGWGNMGFVSHNGSNLNILHCMTVMKAGNWMMGNADGVHIRAHATGPWIENTHIQGIGDDAVALYSRSVAILETAPDGNANSAICDPTFFNFEPGDSVSFFDPIQGIIMLETRVTNAYSQSDGNYYAAFDDALPAGIVTEGNLIDRTQIWNRSKSCGDFVIRNSRFTNIRRFGSVFRARSGIVENNMYEATSSSAIMSTNETTYPNGLYSSDVIIRNNIIDNCTFVHQHWGAIAMHFNKRNPAGGGAGIRATDRGHRRLLIENNRLINLHGTAIDLRGVEHVILRENMVDGITFDPDDPEHLFLENSKDIF